jgi:hypothetical protein
VPELMRDLMLVPQAKDAGWRRSPIRLVNVV